MRKLLYGCTLFFLIGSSNCDSPTKPTPIPSASPLPTPVPSNTPLKCDYNDASNDQFTKITDRLPPNKTFIDVDASINEALQDPNVFVFGPEQIFNSIENREEFWIALQKALCKRGIPSSVGDHDLPLGERDQIQVWITPRVNVGMHIINFGDGGIARCREECPGNLRFTLRGLYSFVLEPPA